MAAEGSSGSRYLKLSLEVTRHLGVAYLPLGLPAAPTSDMRVNSIAFSDDGKSLYAATNDGALSVIDVGSGVRTAEFFAREAGCRLVTPTHHSLGVLHAAAIGGAVTYHNLHENKIVRVFRGHDAKVTSISMNPVSDHFLTVGLDGVFNIWDLRVTTPLGRGRIELPPPLPSVGGIPPEAPSAVGCFDASGQIFAIVLPQRGLAMYSAIPLMSSHEASPIPIDPFCVLKLPFANFMTHPQRVQNMAVTDMLPPPYPVNTSFVAISFSPDGAKIALTTSDRGIIILDAFKPRKEFAVLNAHPHMASHPCGAMWSPDSSQLAVGGADGHAWVYDVSDGPSGLPSLPESLECFFWHPALVRAPAFVILGEAYKTGAALAAALQGSRGHRDALHSLMNERRLRFSKEANKPLSSIGPPLPPLPYVKPPEAGAEDEMASRHDAPLTAIAWHPRSPLVATAARNVALWGLPYEIPPTLTPLLGEALPAEEVTEGGYDDTLDSLMLSPE